MTDTVWTFKTIVYFCVACVVWVGLVYWIYRLVEKEKKGFKPKRNNVIPNIILGLVGAGLLAFVIRVYLAYEATVQRVQRFSAR